MHRRLMTTTEPLATNGLLLKGRRVSRIVVDPRGILFDDTAWHRWLVPQLNRLGLPLEYQTFVERFATERWSDALAGRIDYWTALREYLQTLGCTSTQLAEVELAGKPRWQQLQQQNLRLFPGVQRAWSKLIAAGVPLAILANDLRTSSHVANQLSSVGIRSDWQPIYSSTDLGAALPHPLALQSILFRQQLAAGEVALLSDDAAARQSASSLGITTMALRWVHPIAADLVIDRLADLLTIFAPQLGQTPQLHSQSPLTAGRATIAISGGSVTGSLRRAA